MVAAPSLRCAYLKPGLDALAAQGLDIAAALRRAGLERERLAEPERALDLAELDALVAALARAGRRRDLAFEMARHVPLLAHRAPGAALLPCHSLDHAARLASRHGAASYGLAGFGYERDAAAGVARLEALRHDAPLALRRFCDEFGGVMLATHCLRALQGAPLPFELSLGQPEPAHRSRYDELAPVRVRFDRRRGAGGAVLTLPAALLDRVIGAPPNVQARRAEDAWAARVGYLLRQGSGALPGIEAVAAGLGLSTRTLDRHLARESVTFRALTRAVLLERAQALLLDPRLSVSDVASALGFSNAANFTRAFRRAAGTTPSEFRALRRPPR